MEEDDNILRKRCYRLVEYANNIRPDFELNITKKYIASSSPDNLIVITRKSRDRVYTQAFKYWQQIYACIHNSLILYTDGMHFITNDMSSEEMDMQLAIRGY